VILYILVVAILNMTIGFAMAVYLGRRAERLYCSGEPTALAPYLTPMEGTGQGKESVEESGGETSLSAADLSKDVSSSGVSRVLTEPLSQTSIDNKLAEVLEQEKSPRETCVRDLRDQVERYHEMLAGFDDRLRNLTRAANKEEVGSCLTSLCQANEDYLGSRERVCEVFEQLYREQKGGQAICESVQAAIQRQTQQIVDTNEAIQRFDFDADLQEGCRRLVSKTNKLLEVNDQLRDTLDEAWVAVARDENRLESLEEADRTDPLTGLANRTGLESALAQWWNQESEHQRKLTSAMIDVDHFAQVNEQYGHLVGNRVLKALSQLLTAESKEHIVAARYAGQRFVLLLGDVDVRFTANLVERIRQLVEMTHLRCGDEDIRVTISCAVTEVLADDTPTTLYARSEQTLQEAKRYGRNRTFLHEGKYPAPVVPPVFSLEKKDVDI